MKKLILFIFIFSFLSELQADSANERAFFELDGFFMDSEKAQDFVNKLPSVHIRDSRNKTLLHVTVKKAYEEASKILIKKGVDVNAKDKWGETPLHVAAEYNRPDIAKILIQKGADVNALADHEETPLHVASKKGSSEIAKTLIENKAYVNAKDSSGTTPLHNAASYGYFDITETLLKNGADVIAKNFYKDTPLHDAVFFGHIKIVEILIEKNKKAIFIKNIAGQTALLKAIEGKDNEKTVEILIKAGSNLNEKNMHEETPLMRAIIKDRPSVIEALIRNGANLRIKNRYGQNAYFYISELESQKQIFIRNLLQDETKKTGSKIKAFLGSLFKGRSKAKK